MCSHLKYKYAVLGGCQQTIYPDQQWNIDSLKDRGLGNPPPPQKKMEIKNICFEMANTIPKPREKKEELPCKNSALQHYTLVF
jgi:hypothetical protein